MKKIFVWTYVRTVSTALLKSFQSRGDFACYHEPFNDYYYFGLDRGSRLYGEKESSSKLRSEELISRLVEHKGNVIVKEMAFMASPYLTTDFLREFEHIVLIRNPMDSLRSLKAIKPNFIESEWGVRDLYLLYCRLKSEFGRAPLVIDGGDLRNSPRTVLTKLCEHLDIQFLESMMKWEKGDTMQLSPEDMLSHQRWHGKLRESTGFFKEAGAETAADLDESAMKMLDSANLYYQMMRKDSA